MNDITPAAKLDLPEQTRLSNKVRFVTAASLFDGHDASINIMRRILQSNGAEVVHLGHNRSVDDVVTAALAEDVQGIAISSYQGGHVEYFKYMIDLLRQRGGAHIKVFGGGGGVIVPSEIEELHAYGVTRIFSPEDGQRMGLVGMIRSMLEACDVDLSPLCADHAGTAAAGRHRSAPPPAGPADHRAGKRQGLRRTAQAHHGRAAEGLQVPVLGITGTGGAGKSSLTDELIRRIRLDQNDACNIAIVSIDPSRRKSGGALLGDRIRMNAINPWNKEEKAGARVHALAGHARSRLRNLAGAARRDRRLQGGRLRPVIVETSGIGQGDAAIVPHVDLSMYVMTPEFGAASQLEKIDMLDFADFIAINKFDRKGAQDALRDVAKQYQRNRELWSMSPEQMPVFGTQASRFNDDGVTALYHGLLPALAQRGLKVEAPKLAPALHYSSGKHVIVPPARARYLAEIADTVRGYHRNTAGR
jgi:methylmalonyl-CoA mutase